jgi:hypothetical protein
VINSYLKELLKNFRGKNFMDFAAYIYTTLQKEIDVSKGKHKNKYIKIRKSILNYILSNEREITLELRRNKIK